MSVGEIRSDMAVPNTFAVRCYVTGYEPSYFQHGMPCWVLFSFCPWGREFEPLLLSVFRRMRVSEGGFSLVVSFGRVRSSFGLSSRCSRVVFGGFPYALWYDFDSTLQIPRNSVGSRFNVRSDVSFTGPILISTITINPKREGALEVMTIHVSEVARSSTCTYTKIERECKMRLFTLRVLR